MKNYLSKPNFFFKKKRILKLHHKLYIRGHILVVGPKGFNSTTEQTMNYINKLALAVVLLICKLCKTIK